MGLSSIHLQVRWRKQRTFTHDDFGFLGKYKLNKLGGSQSSVRGPAACEGCCVF